VGDGALPWPLRVVTVCPLWDPPLCATESSPPAAPAQASASDYLSGVAFRTGVPLEKLLADNLDTVKSLDVPLTGTSLVVCR
jgi:hypothetical protein